MPIRPIWAVPAQLEAFRFRTVRLDQDEALSRNLSLNAATQGLECIDLARETRESDICVPHSDGLAQLRL